MPLQVIEVDPVGDEADSTDPPIRPPEQQQRNDAGRLAPGPLHLAHADPILVQLREALKYNPDYILALENLLRALIDDHQYSEAIGIADRVLKAMPNDASAHYWYAVAASNLGRRDDAIRHCRQALEANPRLGVARRLLDRLQRQGD